MTARGTGGRLLLPLAAWLLAVTGVCRGGAARFYTTNTLTEAEPRLAGDYDALIDQVSGDFGVRSEVVAAAGEEPEYRGAETMVVPLYIPKGAVPIKVARIARSDSQDPVVEVLDLTMSPAADSVLIRRIGPVEGRRGPSPPSRGAWRAQQRTRISRLPVIRRSDSVPRRRVSVTSSSVPSSSPASLESTPASPVSRLLPISPQSEFGKRLATDLSTNPPGHHPDFTDSTDTVTKRAKKNELSKDSQFPDELHTTSAPGTTAASPSSASEAEVEVTTRRFSTHLTSSTTTSTPTTTTSSTTTSPSTTTTTTKPSSPQTTTTPQSSTTTTTTTTTQPPSTTTKKPSTTSTTTTTTAASTSAAPSTTSTTTTASITPSSDVTIQRITRAPSSTASTTERRSILFPRPVESVLKIGTLGRSTTASPSSSTPSSTSPSTTTEKPTTTTTSATTTTTATTSTTTTPTGGRSFSLPVRALPSWVRARTTAPLRRGSTTTTTTEPPSTTTTSTTTTTERPHRVRDKLRRLSRLRTGLGIVSSSASTTTTPSTTTTDSRAPHVTPRPAAAPKRTSPVRMMASVSEILNSRAEEEENEKEVENEGREEALDTTIGRSSTTEAYGKTSTTTSKIEVKKGEELETTEGDKDEEVSRTQLPRVDTEGSVSQEGHSHSSGATRKFARRPRPSIDSEKAEGHVRPTGHRRRRPLRPRIKLPPPITYHRASTAPPRETYASTSTTSTTTTPSTTTTQHPYRATVTVTSPTTPKVILTTTTSTTTTTTPVPPTTAATTTVTKTPEQVVIESLTEIMKQATNTSRSKDKVFNIAANLADLNKRLAEQGIHIIHAEVDGVKIKLDNRTITRPRAPPITTFRPSTAIPASTLPAPRPSPSSPSSSLSSAAPPTTPDSQKSVHTSIKSSFSFQTSLSPDTANEVQTTTSDSEPTTTKPTDAKKPDEKPFLAPSRLPTEDGDHGTKNATVSGIPSAPPVSTSGSKPSLDLESHQGASKSILATATVPATVTTRTRSTTVPVNTRHPSVTPSLSLHPATGATTITSTPETDDPPPLDAPRAPTTVHPTSHHRPAYLPRPTDHSNAAEGSETTDNPTVKVVSILQAAELPGSAATVEGVDGEDLQDLKESPRTSYTAVYVISVIGVIPAAGLAFFIARRFLKKTQKALPESEERGEGFTPITHHARKTQASSHATHASHAPTSETDGPSSVEAKNPRFTPWEFPRSKLRLVSILGQGNFGVVWKAEARDLCACEGSQGGPTVLVAVKGVKDGAGAKEKQDLLKELAIMQHLGQHINVVTLLGCCTQQEPYYVIMEYVMFGKLLTFLRDHRTRQNYYNFSSDTAALTSHDLTRFACQVAAGCEYIQSRGIIHRDLASRNVLVDHNKVCKIADFGLARSVKDLGSDIYEQKSRGALPIRWMAPESLYMSIFTHKSDVWSLGILCWEIVTLGSTPYPGMAAREVMRKVREGYRLERPEHCRPELYHIVTRCWHQDLNQRPSFTEIKEDLLELLDNSPTGYIDLENFPESSYYSMHENNDEKL